MKDFVKKLKAKAKGEEIKEKPLDKPFAIKAVDKIKTRRSIRKFSTRQVDWNMIYDIIDAGLNAPSAGNVENTEILVVSNKAKRNEISKIENQQFWLADAPYLLVVIRDNSRLMDLYPGEGELYSVQNTAAVIENMLLIAHFYDLGACWVESCDNEVLKAALGIPSNRHVDAVIPIGYPMEEPQTIRAPAIAKTFFEKYGNKMR